MHIFSQILFDYKHPYIFVRKQTKSFAAKKRGLILYDLFNDARSVVVD